MKKNIILHTLALYNGHFLVYLCVSSIFLYITLGPQNSKELLNSPVKRLAPPVFMSISPSLGHGAFAPSPISCKLLSQQLHRNGIIQGSQGFIQTSISQTGHHGTLDCLPGSSGVLWQNAQKWSTGWQVA